MDSLKRKPAYTCSFSWKSVWDPNQMFINSQRWISPYKFLVPCLSLRVKFTSQQINGKSRTSETNMVLYVIYFWNKQSIHINLISFYRHFDHPHINVVTFVSRKQSKKATIFPQWNGFMLEKTFDRYLLLGLSSFFSQNSQAFFEKLILYCCIFQKLTKILYLTALV